MLEVLLNQLRIARLAEEPRRHPVPKVVDPKVRHARSLQGRPVRTPDPRCGDGDAIALLEPAGLASSCDCRHAGACARLAAASTIAVDAVTTSSFVAWSLADLTWPSYPHPAVARLQATACYQCAPSSLLHAWWRWSTGAALSGASSRKMRSQRSHRRRLAKSPFATKGNRSIHYSLMLIRLYRPVWWHFRTTAKSLGSFFD
jgi:hypothetical protein